MRAGLILSVLPFLGCGDRLQPALGAVSPGSDFGQGRCALETRDTGPPDPVIAGESELRVRLFDAVSGAGLKSRALLWKLDVPANRDWARGDQALGFATLDGAGTTIRHLAPGRYRFVIGERRRGDEDPPEFVVDGASTELRLEVRAARTHRARVRVFDEEGRTLPRLLVARRPLYVSRLRGQTLVGASWATLREGTSEACRPKRFETACSVAAPLGEPELRPADEAGWIALAEIREDTHSAQRWIEFELTAPEDPRAVRLRVIVAGRHLADQDYLCLLPGAEATAAVLGSIRYRDGDPEVGPEHLEWAGSAEVDGALPIREPWRHAPLRATLRHPAYDEKRFALTLADPPPARFLARAGGP